jgi:hypothetical protein
MAARDQLRGGSDGQTNALAQNLGEELALARPTVLLEHPGSIEGDCQILGVSHSLPHLRRGKGRRLLNEPQKAQQDAIEPHRHA